LCLMSRAPCAAVRMGCAWMGRVVTPRSRGCLRRFKGCDPLKIPRFSGRKPARKRWVGGFSSRWGSWPCGCGAVVGA
jgi:hypothetical protein